MTDVDVMNERIQEWKKAHELLRELNFEMLCKVLRLVNDESAIKIARNPLDKDHNWISETVCYNVGTVTLDEEGRLTFSIRRDNTEFTVAKLNEQIERLKKRMISQSSAIMVRVSDSKTVQITDVYSHALVRDSWAGLPFDIVLAYYEED